MHEGSQLFKGTWQRILLEKEESLTNVNKYPSHLLTLLALIFHSGSSE